MFLRALILSAALLCAAVPSAVAAEPPPGSDWSQAYFDSADGNAKLHADILRPKGLPADAKTPVILSIGPYFNHSGQVGVLGPVQDAPYDPIAGGPSERFYDFINGAKVFERGYTWVQVDLRGFGG
jgi:predicted acyl esterase